MLLVVKADVNAATSKKKMRTKVTKVFGDAD